MVRHNKLVKHQRHSPLGWEGPFLSVNPTDYFNPTALASGFWRGYWLGRQGPRDDAPSDAGQKTIAVYSYGVNGWSRGPHPIHYLDSPCGSEAEAARLRSGYKHCLDLGNPGGKAWAVLHRHLSNNTYLVSVSVGTQIEEVLLADFASFVEFCSKLEPMLRLSEKQG